MSDNNAAAARGAMQRLFKELTKWRKDQARNEGGAGSGEEGIERLGPVDEDDLFNWEAVINGRGIGLGYDSGRWLISISIPTTYPLHPPKMRFVTPVVHANVKLHTGEICLDLLAAAWTPVYGIVQTVRAVRDLLASPETSSPLNIDVAALLTAGDDVAARSLVEYWCMAKEGGRYNGA